MDQVVALLEQNEEDFDTVYIQPPEACSASDEDSDFEDGNNVDSLPGSILKAEVEVACKESYQRMQAQEDDQIQPEFKETKRKRAEKLTWEQKDIKELQLLFPEPNLEGFRTKSPVELFQLFFTEEIFDLILQETIRYATSKDPKVQNISKSDIKCFFGILLLSGYAKLPARRMYWQDLNDVHNIAVSESMRRDTFDLLMRYIHFANNEAPTENDKLFKLRLLISKLNENFLNSFVPECQLSYDEAMIRYFGSSGLRQYICNKPIRFGFKVWCLTASSGYLVQFEIYQGRTDRITSREPNEKRFGKCTAPLIDFIDKLPKYNFSVYFDNLFTSIDLLTFLQTKGIRATGTIRDNQIPRNSGLPSKKKQEKEQRGSSSIASNIENNILICQWKDNKVVSIASNCHTNQPMSQCSRFCRKQRKRINVNQPHVVRCYNKYMGGVDLMDKNVNCYRVGIRGRKWYFPIFTWMIDAAVQNAWLIHRKCGGKLSNLEFRRNIARHFLNTFSQPKSRKRTYQSRMSLDQRYDERNHYIKITTDNKRRRCVGEMCTSVVRSECRKCDVGLCISCFEDYHTSV